MDQIIEKFLRFQLEPSEESRLLDYLQAHPDFTIESIMMTHPEPYGRQVWVNDILMFGDSFSGPGLLD